MNAPMFTMKPVGLTVTSAFGSNFTGQQLDERCIKRKDPSVVALSVIPVVALICNALVMVAVFLYRSKLRQNNVYIYVFSVLASNILFNALSIYQLLNHYYQFEGNTAKSFSPVRSWWVFRQALLVANYMIMNGNIGALIYAIRAGNYIVAKAASAHALRTENSSSIQTQRRKAYFLVSVAWCIPLALALLTLTGWNCSETCECLSACYAVEDLESTPRGSCSRVMSSLSNSYMGVVVIVWLAEIAMLFFMICKTFSHSVLLSAGWSPNKVSVKEPVERAEVMEYIEPHDEQAGELQTATDASDRRRSGLDPTLDVEKSSSRLRKVSRKQRRIDRRQRRYARWLRTASKQLAFLAVLFFVCTVPAMVCTVIDIFREQMIPSVTTSVLISLSLLYTIICPVVLARDMAGLKSSLVSLALKFFPSTKTSRTGSGAFTSSTASDSERKGSEKL